MLMTNSGMEVLMGARYGSACFAPFQDVEFCAVQFGSHRGDAYTRSQGMLIHGRRGK